MYVRVIRAYTHVFLSTAQACFDKGQGATLFGPVLKKNMKILVGMCTSAMAHTTEASIDYAFVPGGSFGDVCP
jgi:hypothetical protein